MSIIKDLPTENETIALGHVLADWLQAGDVVLLQGDLGAGKSTFARACIQAMKHDDGKSYAEDVPSPTFTLVQTYERAAGLVWHFDLYRLGDPEELYDLGWEEALSDGICLIEWPDRLQHFKPKQVVEIELLHEGEGRMGKITATNMDATRLGELEAAL